MPKFEDALPAFGSLFPLSEDEKLLGISEYVPMPGRENVSISPENPLFYNNDILLHSISTKMKRPLKVKIFLPVRGKIANTIYQPISWRLEDISNKAESYMPRSVKHISTIEHINGVNGILFELQFPATPTGDYLLKVQMQDKNGYTHISSTEVKLTL